MNSGWRGIVVSCLLTIFVLTTAFVIGVDSAGVAEVSHATPEKFRKCWNSDKKGCQIHSGPVFGDYKECWCMDK